MKSKKSTEIMTLKPSQVTGNNDHSADGHQSFLSQDRASVALEYVLVSSFAAVAGIALLGLAASIFKSKVDTMMESLDLDPGEYRLSPFESFDES